MVDQRDCETNRTKDIKAAKSVLDLLHFTIIISIREIFIQNNVMNSETLKAC